MIVLFHLALLAVDAFVLLALARRPRGRTLVAGLAAAAAVGSTLAVVLAAGFHGGTFVLIRLLTLGIFVHAPLLLGGGVWFLRQPRPRVALLALTGALAVAAVGVFAHFIEPHRLEIRRVEIQSPKLLEPVRLLVVADYQTDEFGAWERRVWSAVLAEKPDILLLTGDYLQIADPARRDRVRRETRAHLDRIGFQAPRGVFAVRGDVDTDDWAELFQGLPVMTFKKTRTIELRGLTLTALSAVDSRRRGLRIPVSPRFHVVFGHAPDYALNNLPADLQLAGHTHGGQVRLPGIGPLLTFSRVPREWAAGVTDLGAGRTLIVSRGIGMERAGAPRIRFLCRPELVVIDLVP